MLGAIAGDIIGSVYEYFSIKTTTFSLFQKNSRFTDDTVLTVATAHAILEKLDYATSFKMFGRRYPDAGYGSSFINWVFEDEVKPYNSWGNGSAMRVSPVGLAFETIDKVLDEAEKTAICSHDHPEGIKGAQATALAVFLARKGEDKEKIKREISKRFAYNLHRTLEFIRINYTFNESCQKTVPEAIIAFLESENFEGALRNAVSLGGDSDTLACITGAIAHAFYKKIPGEITCNTQKRLPREFLEIIAKFQKRYPL